MPEKLQNLEFLPHLFFLLRSQVELSKKKKLREATHKKKVFDILPEMNERVEQSSSHDAATKHEKIGLKFISKLLSFPSCSSFFLRMKKKSKNALYEFLLCNLNPSTATEHTHLRSLKFSTFIDFPQALKICFIIFHTN